MKLPKRPDTHVIEAESWRILQALAPKEWILREITERDYGIDCYIEMCSTDGEITGDLISIQLKGVNKIPWKESSSIATARSPSINTTTANYWLQLPVPVFLFVADLTKKDIYFVSVEQEIRTQYEKFLKQKSISFKLLDKLSLKSVPATKILYWLYIRERLHNEFSFHITNLLSHINIFREFITYNQNRDCFLEVDAEQHLQFRAIYESCKMASLYLENEWKMESLAELYNKDRDEWKDKYTYLHEQTLDYALRRIEKIFPTLVRKALKHVTQKQGSYWLHKDEIFFNVCLNANVEYSLSQFEQALF